MGGFGPPTQSFKGNSGIKGYNDEMTFDLISNSDLTTPNTTKPTSASEAPANMFQLATQTTERNILCGHTSLGKRIWVKLQIGLEDRRVNGVDVLCLHENFALQILCFAVTIDTLAINH